MSDSVLTLQHVCFFEAATQTHHISFITRFKSDVNTAGILTTSSEENADFLICLQLEHNVQWQPDSLLQSSRLI